MLITIPGSRYVYELYYKKEAISKALYDWLLKNAYADANLIAKWCVPCEHRDGGTGLMKRQEEAGLRETVLHALHPG
jgi:hypothetical protein